MSNKKRIAVIFGGQSSEHEVSRVSAESVIRNINTDKYEIVMIGINREGKWLPYDGPIEKIGSGEWEQIALSKAAKSQNSCLCDSVVSKNGISMRDFFSIIGAESESCKLDAVFPVLHGVNGEDGTIQGVFELAEIPYVGCGVLAASVGMDKAYTKIVFADAGIPQGEYLVFTRKQIAQNEDTIINNVESKLKYPCFVKPSNAGSSVGVSKTHNRDELIKSLHFAAKYDRKVLVEEFINGREVECAVLGNDDAKASTVGEVVPCNEFYDYKAKYIDNNSELIIPAQFPDETIQKIREYAVRAFKSLDGAGLSRVDFFVQNETGDIYINEINTLPGFTSISMYPKLWEVLGIPYSELIERLIDLAIERYEDNKKTY